jgi:hypothetical protein
VGITAEVLEDAMRSAERGFGIDDSSGSLQWVQILREGLRLAQGLEVAEKPELAGRMGFLQSGEKQTPEPASQHSDR